MVLADDRLRGGEAEEGADRTHGDRDLEARDRGRRVEPQQRPQPLRAPLGQEDERERHRDGERDERAAGSEEDELGEHSSTRVPASLPRRLRASAPGGRRSRAGCSAER